MCASFCCMATPPDYLLQVPFQNSARTLSMLVLWRTVDTRLRAFCQLYGRSFRDTVGLEKAIPASPSKSHRAVTVMLAGYTSFALIGFIWVSGDRRPKRSGTGTQAFRLSAWEVLNLNFPRLVSCALAKAIPFDSISSNGPCATCLRTVLLPHQTNRREGICLLMSSCGSEWCIHSGYDGVRSWRNSRCW